MANCGPFIIVSPKGLVSGAVLPNDGANYGPDTVGPGGTLTTTSGIQEAINSIQGSGGVVYLLPTGVFSVGATITVPSNVEIRSGMIGGEAYNSGATGGIDTPPSSYVNYTPTSGDCFLLGNGVTAAVFHGVAVKGASAPPANGSVPDPATSPPLTSAPQGAMFRGSGCRNILISNCYAQNTAGPAIAFDGYEENAESNSVSMSYFSGKSAIRIGYPTAYLPAGKTALQNANDCTWVQVTAEVTDGASNVVDTISGTGHQFRNLYSRIGTTGAILNGAASLSVVGGELLNWAATTTRSTTSKLIANITGGTWLFRDLAFTAGSVTISGGTVSFQNVLVNSAPSGKSVGSVTVNGASVNAFIDRYCNFGALGTGGVTIGTSSCDLYLDTRNPLWDPAAVASASGSGRIHPDSPAAPSPASAATFPYTNTNKNLQMAMMWGGTGVAAVLLNGSPAGLNQTTGPWFLVLRYKDNVTVAAGVQPSLAVYDVT